MASNDDSTSPATTADLGPVDHAAPHFSFSQLNMLMRCPKQYEYRYGLGIKRPPSLIMASGTSVHAAMERNNLTKIDSGNDETMSVLLDITAEEHDKAMVPVEDATKEEKGENKDENIEIVRAHRRVIAPHIEPIAAEQPFTLHVPSDDRGDYLPVIGYIDTTARVPDPRQGPTQGRPVMAIEDYKRVGRMKPQNEIDLSIQLTMYDYVHELTTGELPDVIGLRLMGFNGPRSKSAQGPGPYSHPMYRDQRMMQPEARRRRHLRVIDQVRVAQRAVKDGNFYPVDDPKICGWCGYKDICQPDLP